VLDTVYAPEDLKHIPFACYFAFVNSLLIPKIYNAFRWIAKLVWEPLYTKDITNFRTPEGRALAVRRYNEWIADVKVRVRVVCVRT
jgi:hypothetical protein